jgi:hypothetical protein
VSRRFIKATEVALTDLLTRGSVSLDLVAFMVDGVHFADHVCVVALGITIDGTKVPLALEEGSTENATLVTSLIVGLRERGPPALCPPKCLPSHPRRLASRRTPTDRKRRSAGGCPSPSCD